MKPLCKSLLLATLSLLFSALFLTSPSFAQVAGPNVNMVSGTSWPNGDPFLQRQNEPSMAVSSRNPMHILAGANDYRSVDLELVLSGGAETGDSWLGLFKSFDGGLTWQSTLLQGCPYSVAQCKDNGALGGNFQAASDPVVRAGTNGMFYYAGLAFDRATSATTASPVSSIFVARYNDLNNNENIDPITYIDTHIVATGNSTQFLDKPALAVDIPRNGAATCSFTAQEPGTGPNGGTLAVPQSFKAGNVYLAYTDFLQGTKSNATPTHLMFTHSTDCGVTWSTPVQINTGTATSQGSAIAVNPVNGNVYVAWRQFASTGIANAIMVAQSTNFGRTFSAPVQISTSTFQPFDQGTSNTSFRTNAYPSITTDNFGFVYVAFSARGLTSSGDARVVAAGSLDGTHWTPPIMVDNASYNASTNPSGRGHQVMPAITFANGRLTLLYYDLRYDHYENVYTENSLAPGTYTPTLTPEGELALPTPETSLVFNSVIDDRGLTLRRHTIDLRTIEFGIFPTVVLGPSVSVSQYAYGCCVNPNMPDVEQFKFNVPNLPLFALGTEPFLGDYIEVVPSPLFIPNGNNWAYNFTPSVNPLFHATWTDNRDVVPPADGNWANYTPAIPAGTQSIFQSNKTVNGCSIGNEGMRNQNIYTAQITGGLVVGAPGNSKPLGTTQFTNSSGVTVTVPFQRAFAVEAQNVTNQQIFVRFTIANQPTGGSASFLQFSQLTTLDQTIPALSSVSRSVFVTSTNPQATITVNVQQISAIGGTIITNGLSQSAILNPDITNPNITNPNITNPNITNPNITNFEVTTPNITNADPSNPNITNLSVPVPNITNPDITNPNITNPNITNSNVPTPNITNTSAVNINAANPNITNPDTPNPNITNPNITNPDITNGSIQDVIYPMTNNGNTTATYTVKVATFNPPPGGILLQMILNKLYQTPTANNCQLAVQTHWVTVANITNPKLFASSDPQVGNPDITNTTPNEGSVTLAPGETVYITLRVVNPTPQQTPFNPLNSITPVTIAQAVNTQTVLANPGNTNLTAPPVYPQLTILSPATLPATDQSDPTYSYQLQTTGGKPGTGTWTIVGGALPSGLNLSPSGLITGQTNAIGPNSVTIQVADSASPANTTKQTFSIPVSFAFVTNVPGIINDAIVNQAYVAFPFTTTGGTGPIVWTATGLPPGLAINGSTGQITGAPTAINTAGYPVQVTATDSALPPVVLSRSFNIRVANVIAIAPPAPLPSGTIGVTYSAQFSATGGIGAAYTFGPAGQPNGVTLSSSGLLTISNPQTSPINFSVSATDQASPTQTQTANYSITFNPPAVVLKGTTLTPQPGNSIGGQLLAGSPLQALVIDATSAPIPNASVTMSISPSSPGCATAVLGGTLTQVTNASGIATFPDLTINRGQIGYRLDVTASVNSQFALELTSPFTVNGFCPTGSFTTSRGYPTVTTLNDGTVLVAGGETDSSSNAATNAADIYNPSATTYTPTLGGLVSARFLHTATLLNNGTVLIVGGMNGSTLITTAEIYDPLHGTFSNTAHDPLNTRIYHTATLLADGTVLIAGGQNPGVVTTAEIYNPATQTFTAVGTLNFPRSHHTATLLPNGKVLLAAGNINATLLPSAELYDPIAQTFSTTGNLNNGRQYHSASLLSSGQVLVAGGLQLDSATGVGTAELYDPVGGTFTNTGSLNTARGVHSATTLPDGTILVVGGYNCPGTCTNPILASAEVYSPASGSFSVTGSLTNARWQHGAALLNDGTVIVAGGFGGGNFLNSSEIYYSTALQGGMAVTTATPVVATQPPATSLFSNSTAFNGAATAITNIGFNGILPAGTSNLDYSPLVLSGATFATPQPSTSVNVTTASFYNSQNSVFPPYSADFIVDSANSNQTNQLVITLPAPTRAVAVNYGALGFHGASSGNITLSNGYVMPLASLPTEGQQQFAGFVSSTPITSLTYTVNHDDWVLLSLLTGNANVNFPNATEGSNFTQLLLEQGGVGPLSWSLQSGTLPPGVNLSSSGILNGIPTTAGTYNFIVAVTDSSNPQKLAASGTITLTVVPQPPTNLTATLTAGTTDVNLSWSASLSNDVVGYKLYRGTSPGSLTAITTVAASPTVDNPGATGTFYYAFTAVTASGIESPFSNEVSIVVP